MTSKRRETFLQEVYNVLYERHPQGLTFSQLGSRVRRSEYPGSAKFHRLSQVDPRSFHMVENTLFAKKDSPRARNVPGFIATTTAASGSSTGADPAVGGAHSRAEDVASAFYLYLEEHFKGNPSESNRLQRKDVEQLFHPWRAQVGARTGLYYVLQWLQKTKKLRCTKSGHLRFAFFDCTRVRIDHALSNKAGIEIGEITFPETLPPNTPYATEIVITNKGSKPRNLKKVEVSKFAGHFVVNIRTPCVIAPRETRAFALAFEAKDIGTFASSLAFHFEGFSIVRLLLPKVSADPALRAELKATVPFTKKKKLPRPQASLTEFAERPPSSGKKFAVPLLSEYTLSSREREQLGSGDVENVLVDFMNNYETALGDPDRAKILTHYAALTEKMLFAEEFQMEKDMDQYNMESAVLQRENSFFFLDVPGLAEKRPSVVIGDSVLIALSGHDEAGSGRQGPKGYTGFVWDVELTRVKLRMPRSFTDRFFPGLKVNVFFSFKRTTLKLMHDTFRRLADVTDAVLPIYRAMLFPGEATLMQEKIAGRNFFNRALNANQQCAVRSITAEFDRSSAFVLFGPPGTGKTVTLVEAIKQLHRMLDATRPRGIMESIKSLVGVSSNKRLLVMAPSNYAADLLVERLSDTINEREMFRYMSYSRKHSDVSANVLKYCRVDGNNHFVPLGKSELRQFKVIVSTCATAGRLFYYGLKPKDFAAFLIDESGHCWESEAVLGFANLVDPAEKQLLVLAGDPQQLGPITRSPYADMTRFNVSMLERFVNSMPVFTRDVERFPDTNGYNPSYIVKLTNCYRCHEEIMRIPNELFYNNDLRPAADPLSVEACLAWEGLPTENFPMLFHGCVGEEQREASSPSWFNIEEIEQVLKYVKSLRDYGARRGISLADIGIIAPYHSQVKKLKKALQLKNLQGCTVGSCEQFQGQERKIIIISTVRSSLEYLQSDEKFNIGFLSNPKRFNVAVTRAKALVIVVGNPQVLATDPCWARLLWHCVDNNSYVGVPLPERRRPDGDGDGDDDDIGDLIAQAQRLNMDEPEELEDEHVTYDHGANRED